MSNRLGLLRPAKKASAGRLEACWCLKGQRGAFVYGRGVAGFSSPDEIRGHRRLGLCLGYG